MQIVGVRKQYRISFTAEGITLNKFGRYNEVHSPDKDPRHVEVFQIDGGRNDVAAKIEAARRISHFLKYSPGWRSPQSDERRSKNLLLESSR